MSASRLEACRRRRYGRPRAQEMDRRVAGRILERRRRLGLTTRQVADRLGLSLDQVRKIEAGAQMVTPRQLHAIAELLDVDVTYLFGTDDTGGRNGSRGEDSACGQLLADFAVLQRSHREAILGLSRVLASDPSAED